MAVEIAHAGKVEGLVAIHVGDVHAAAQLAAYAATDARLGWPASSNSGTPGKPTSAPCTMPRLSLTLMWKSSWRPSAAGRYRWRRRRRSCFCEQHDTLQQRPDIAPLSTLAVPQCDTEFGQLLEPVGDFLRVQLRHVNGDQVREQE
jgi:hypothetical protein